MPQVSKLFWATGGKELPGSRDNWPLGEVLRFLIFQKVIVQEHIFLISQQMCWDILALPWQVLKNTSVSHMVKYLTSAQRFILLNDGKVLLGKENFPKLYALASWNIIC